MRSCLVEIGSHKIECQRAEGALERMQGMRAFSEPEPLLLLAPLIHTFNSPEIDIIWIRGGKVIKTAQSKPSRLYFAPAAYCLELPAGYIDKLSIKKGAQANIS